MARNSFTTVESLVTQAEAAYAQDRMVDAERSYRELAAQTHEIDFEYNDWLRRLAEIYERLGWMREAGYISLYLHYFDRCAYYFQGPEAGAERARSLFVQRHWDRAAQAYISSGLPIHAAVAYERGEHFAEAADIWRTLVNDGSLHSFAYEDALARFNWGGALRKQAEEGSSRETEAERALVDSQRRLEQVADDFEIRGERERAFDCYQILLKLGRDSGQFENLAEGYLNCIRVLRSDNLKFYVLQYYEDFIRIALERHEYHAAASLYQEVSEYAARSNLPYDRHYQEQAGLAWENAARSFADQGAAVELCENAYLSALSCFAGIGKFSKVRELFEQLSELPLAEKRKARYYTISLRYAKVHDQPLEVHEFPDYLKQKHAYADIWFVDLMEWELKGNPRDVALSILGDLRYPDGIRRRALVICLNVSSVERRGQGDDANSLVEVAELLGELQSYAALKPLERLFQSELPTVRRAAVRALRFLYFKRSFALLRLALDDPDNGVRESALEAIAGLHFPHAFNPLARIYREHIDLKIRTTALKSIGRIQSVEAGEFLLQVLREEEGSLQRVAQAALAGIENADLQPIVEAYLEIESNEEIRDILGGLLRRQAA